MKKIVLIILATITSYSHAYTSCENQVLTKVFNDGSNTYIGTGGLNGRISNTKADYKGMLSILLSARVAGKPVEIRYERDGVQCGNAAWNEEISGVGI